MRVILNGLLVGLICTLTAGPLFAAPVSLQAQPSLTTSTVPASPSHGAGALALLSGVAVFGLTVKRDIGSIAQKWNTRASAAAGDYKSGVQGAGGKWESATGAAEANWEQGTQAAMTAKRFTKGVAGKGGKYSANAVALGSQRYAGGVANAVNAYQAGMQPVIAALNGVNLPPKSFRGSPANQARSNAVSTALAALRSNS